MLLAGVQADNMVERSIFEGFLAKYNVGSHDSQSSAANYNKLITPSLRHVRYGGRPNALSNHAIPAEQGFVADNGGIGVLVVSDKPVSTFPDQTTYPTAGTQDAMISTSGEEEPLNIEDFNLLEAADKEEEKAAQKMPTDDSSMPMTLAGVGVAGVALLGLAASKQRGQQQATSRTSSGGLESDTTVANNTVELPGATSVELQPQANTPGIRAGGSAGTGDTIAAAARQHVDDDIGRALREHLEVLRAGESGTATASKVLDRSSYLCRKYAARGSKQQARARLAALVAALEASQVPLSAKFCTNAVSAFVSVGAAEAGAELFQRCVNGADGFPQPNRHLLTAGVQAFGKIKRVDLAFAAAREMDRWDANPVDARLGNALLSAAVQNGDLRRAELVFNAMTRLVFDAAHRREAIAGPIADAASYAVMIDGYARTKRPADAAATLDSMQAAGFDAGRIAYSALMKAHVEAGDLQAAEACLSDLEHAADGVLAETKTLLKAERLRKNGKRYQALKQRRRALHQRIAPDTACWNTLIRGYAKTLQWKKAWSTLARMRKAGIAPDLLSYTNAATACLKADRPEEALKRIAELKSAHAKYPRGSRKAQMLRPNIVAYTIAVRAHAKLGDLPSAYATMGEMRSNGVAPNAKTWAAMLECCLSAGEPQAVVRIVTDMHAAGIEEDVVTLTLLLRCHFASGDKAAAAKLLRRMERSALSTGGVAPNLVTYNAAIAGFLHFGDQKAALASLDAAAQRFAPNRETWAVLADAVTKQNAATFLHDALTCLMSRNKAA